jgi:hypothetical protein
MTQRLIITIKQILMRNTALNTSIDTKANSSNVYTKAQTDAALLLKANVADVYTKTASDAALTLKANAADVYTKTDADTKFRLISDSYTN